MNFLKKVGYIRIFLLLVILVVFYLILSWNETGFENINKQYHNFLLFKESESKETTEKSMQNEEHKYVVKKFFQKRKDLHFSNLGKILFLNESRPPEKNRQFKIMVYKIGTEMEEMTHYFYRKVRHDPFEECSVKNCILSYDDDFQTADAVLFHLHKFNLTYNTPNNVSRPSWQRWIFFSMESAWHTFYRQANNWFNYSGVFNWSMTMSVESDVPTAAGRIIPLKTPIRIPDDSSFQEKFEKLVPYAKNKRRDVLVAILSSCCEANGRKKYVEELQQHLAVDVYGGCTIAPKHLRELCPWNGYGEECQELRKYLFYLAFENSNCKAYASEKVYSHSFRLGSVPVYMGMYQSELDPLVPPNSYLHIDDFKSAEDLAKFILHINATLEENYLKFHEWRKDFESLSEDGYMGAKCYHYCRICEALNYNDEKPKIYFFYYLSPLTAQRPFTETKQLQKKTNHTKYEITLKKTEKR